MPPCVNTVAGGSSHFDGHAADRLNGTEFCNRLAMIFVSDCTLAFAGEHRPQVLRRVLQGRCHSAGQTHCLGSDPDPICCRLAAHDGRLGQTGLHLTSHEPWLREQYSSRSFWNSCSLNICSSRNISVDCTVLCVFVHYTVILFMIHRSRGALLTLFGHGYSAV